MYQSYEEWVKMMPDDVAKKFLANAKKQNNLDPSYVSAMPELPLVIGGAFVWATTPEGHEYWRDVESKSHDWQKHYRTQHA